MAEFWHIAGAACAAIARRAGCTFRDSPLPEIREVAREFERQPVGPYGDGAEARGGLAAGPEPFRGPGAQPPS